MVGTIAARRALLLLLLILSSPAVADEPCENVEKEQAITRETSVSINTATEIDLVPIPPIFVGETATLKLSGQININRNKYQDQECFLFFCHDVTRIRNNFVSPDQYKVVLKIVTMAGEAQPVSNLFGSTLAPIPTDGLLSESDPRDSVRLYGAIAPGNGGIVRLGCGTDPDVCSEGSYTASVAITSGLRAKKLFEFLSKNRMSYSEIANERILNENLRNSSKLIKQCVGRSLLAQANAFHGPGTGESPAERQKILQEALFWSPDDALVKGALAATYVETGQYAQARETGEDTVASLEKRIQSPEATAADYDALAAAYATLAEVDWREVAGISSKGVAAGIADLNLALDRTDKRLDLFSFDKGADAARRARGGYAVRLAAMLARTGSLQGFEEAATTLTEALQVLPEPVAGRPLALDLTRGDIVSSIRVDRAVIDRAWAETRTELPLATRFTLSPFPSDPTGTEATRVAWDATTGGIIPIRQSVSSPKPNKFLQITLDKNCRVTEAVGTAEGNAAALVSCADGGWNIVTTKGVVSTNYTGKARSLAISGAGSGQARRLFALVDEGVKSWTLGSDGNLTEDKWPTGDWRGADQIRTGPDPSLAAVRKENAWQIVRLDSDPPLSVDLVCNAGTPAIHDVAFAGEPAEVLAVGPGCGLTRGDLTAFGRTPSAVRTGIEPPPAGTSGKPEPFLLQQHQPIKVHNGTWPVVGEMRIVWAGRLSDPVAVVAFKGDGAKILAFAPPASIQTEAGIERMDLYVSDLDSAFLAKAHGDLRVRSLTFDARPVEGDRAGRRMLWPNLDVEVRGVMGTLIGYDPLVRSPLQKTDLVNGADYRELRRGRVKIWGLTEDELKILPLASLNSKQERNVDGIPLPDFKAEGRKLGFEIDEDSSTIQTVWSTDGNIEYLAILRFDGSLPGSCGIGADKFEPGICSASQAADKLGAGPSDTIMVVNQNLSAMQPHTRPTALVVRKSASMDVFSFPLGMQPVETFPFGKDSVPIGFTNSNERTLFVIRDGKIAAARNGVEVGATEAPEWANLGKTVRISSEGRLLLVGGENSPEKFGYRIYDATGVAMTVATCSPVCPLTSADFGKIVKEMGVDPSNWGTAFPLTIAPDLSSVVFLAGDPRKPRWQRSASGGTPSELKARPGLPLLYINSPDEDVLSLQASETTVEQWSFDGTARRDTPLKQDRNRAVAGPESSPFKTVSMVFFPEWSDQPLASSEIDIASAAACLIGWPEAEIAVIGHTSANGRTADNLSLSMRRARRIVDLLIAKGVPAERLAETAKGLGEQGAVVENPGFDRRTEIRASGQINNDQKARCGS